MSREKGSRDEQRASRRAQRRWQNQRAARRRRLLALAGAVGVAVVVVTVLILLNRPGEVGDNPPVQAATLDYGAIPRDGRVLGDPGAPVLVVEWGDYQCPACRQFKEVFFPQLLQDYVMTGKIRFEYRDFAFIGEESTRAAEAAMCALEQGKFWEYHDALFANQLGENVGSFSDDRLRQIAAAAGLDRDQFQACLASGTHRAEVQAMFDEARQAGINATPSFFVNGQKVEIRSYQDLLSAIEAELGG